MFGCLSSAHRILEPGEVVQSASLGAGNTNRRFNLETDPGDRNFNRGFRLVVGRPVS